MRQLGSRARKAIALAREHGVRTLLQQIAVRARRRNRLDEAHLVFEAVGRQRGVMIDVGAHEGGALAPYARAGWQVYAFEPDAQNRAVLAERHGPSANVVIDARAVGERPAEEAAFYRSAISTGISGLSSFHGSHVASGTVEVTTLADACTAWRIHAIDVLKIDTEGHDLFVLRGVPWQQLAPGVILCELEDAKTVPLGYTFHDLARFLVERDYRVIVSEWYPVKQYGLAHAWRRFARYPCELADARGWGNLIATRSPTTYDALWRLCEAWSSR